ncbi:O-antigen ligase family protein [Microbacterium capsulatum]|uniref:O-antigen ligase family protein n=1 Tax=Microbacterium capsulatum TaxID=3041921 RepID=A0ABU0XGM2_9MICO|nr:O-antigen ligase family protein [Microbacterium sp. ASV81]MDQ4214269.1 O-antigen ligase family protein [Microbacterium sp. ASV81]
MSLLAGSRVRPVSAETRNFTVRHGGVSAATMLTVYLVLLVAIPSNVTISALGSLGRPSMLWGLVLLFWWLLSRLQARDLDARPVRQPLRWVFMAFLVVVLVSFAAAMLRGQPADQVSPATTALLRLASWSGVLLVAMDGIRTYSDAAALVRRLAIAGAALAAFGLAQFFSGQTLLDWTTSIPGLAFEATEAATRGSFTRASGTAIHPLEYGTAVVSALPLAITAAVNKGFRTTPSRNAGWWWLAVGFILLASLVAVSRSAIIGLAVAVITLLPAIPTAYRWVIGVGGAVLAGAVFALIPGMFGTIVKLFVGASDDPSTQSRTAALARVPEFLSSSPLIGQGFGTFLPRYYIFDDAWVLLTVELGVLGALCLGGMVSAAIGSAVWASGHSPFQDTKSMSRAFASCLITIAVLFAFFDGLSFPMSAGLLFLMIGLTASMRSIAAADEVLTASMRYTARPELPDVATELPPARRASAGEA